MKSIEYIAKVLNIEIENIDDILTDVDEDEYEILSDEKHLTMDKMAFAFLTSFTQQGLR